MNDLQELNRRVRMVWRMGLLVLALSLIALFVFPHAGAILKGLLLGELGGIYVIYSMIRQGHVKDGMEGRALFASGMMGMVTRLVVLVTVLIVAIKSGLNPYAALVGYLIGLVLIVIGMWGMAQNSRRFPGGK
ncbi:hypothetical protein [Ferroacidibacillus organovorans]|uniref:hypothetical protein n=1 Tax=Ferroacidibacillus organovorans TaxID=1765683 RepID=UPI0008374779|nr:hypothetical protein [Ferroacidibacillus organovorans]